VSDRLTEPNLCRTQLCDGGDPNLIDPGRRGYGAERRDRAGAASEGREPREPLRLGICALMFPRH